MIITAIQLGLAWGMLFGAMFCLATLVIGRINAEMLLNNYPPDVKAKFGPMSPEARRQANLASLFLIAVLLPALIGGLAQLRAQEGNLSWGNTFVLLFVLLQVWNLIDLVVLDWLILMTFRPPFMVLPGTEGLPGYSNYRFHLRKFLNGIVFTTLFAGILTILAMGFERIV